ncbi:unnamed protein product [Ostreobium quekettii]|uniref:F-box domain-containing protein n=1 Tax=Ostreobium quekettii TaxID=121088 RepID=A0A8S1IP25_9CHLO|nr:unnamed protein product [Ostreobium quekettii]
MDRRSTKQKANGLHRQREKKLAGGDERPEPAVGVEAIPDAVLADIFELLPFEERRDTVPLVCKWWSRLTVSEPHIWKHCRWDGQERREDDDNSGEMSGTIDWPRVVEWFIARAEGVQTLQVSNFEFRFSPEVPTFSVLLALLCPSLRELRLVRCKMGRDSWMGLLCLQGLRRLDLLLNDRLMSWRSISHLSRLTNLDALHIEYVNRTFEYESDIPGPITVPFAQKLTTLRLKNFGDLKAIVPSWCFEKWRGMEMLDLCGTEVMSLTESISVLTNLAELHVWTQSKLPTEISRLTNLRMLSTRDTPSLGALCGMSRLRELEFNLNRAFESVEDLQVMSGLAMLTSLKFKWPGGYFPQELTGLSALRYLDLSDDSLSDLPSGPYLDNLTELDLSWNGFSQVPGVLWRASNLVRLSLAYNDELELGELAVDAILEMEDLLFLDIRWRRFHSVLLLMHV